MYAVIASGGKQHKVTIGDTIHLEILPHEVGDIVSFEEVLLYADDDRVLVGTPYVANAQVQARVIRHARGDKVKIIHFKRRKHHMRVKGHRQNFTEVEITAINT